MKNFKKIIILCSVFMLTGCESALSEMGFSKASPESVINENVSSSETEDVEEETSAETAADYDNDEKEISAEDVSDKPEIIYDDLYYGILESLENMEMTSEYRGSVDRYDIGNTIEKITQTHPEFFWIDGYTTIKSLGKTEVQINPVNDYPAEKLSVMLDELVSAGDRLISDIPSGADDFEKVVFVHDYIVNHTTYDTAGAEIIEKDLYDEGEKGLFGTAYGCLVEGSAVCQGYAEAFQYIMNRIGIESGICHGSVSDGPHAWNYVKLNNKYYWIDVTWDDPVPEENGTEVLRHTYCLIDDERMLNSHLADYDCLFIPKCYSMEENYFVRNNAYLSYYSGNGIAGILESHSEDGEVEIMFADSNSYSEAVKRLFENGEIWDFISSEEVTYSGDDSAYILKIIY